MQANRSLPLAAFFELIKSSPARVTLPCGQRIYALNAVHLFENVTCLQGVIMLVMRSF